MRLTISVPFDLGNSFFRRRDPTLAVGDSSWFPFLPFTAHSRVFFYAWREVSYDSLFTCIYTNSCLGAQSLSSWARSKIPLTCPLRMCTCFSCDLFKYCQLLRSSSGRWNSVAQTEPLFFAWDRSPYFSLICFCPVMRVPLGREFSAIEFP